MALVDLDLKLKRMDAKILHTMHDEIIVKTKARIADEVPLILKQTMEEAGRALLKIAPVEVEVIVADSWAEK
jgi:DNA polymerase I-like protein with 3'-5' exonuclease and polymerase domains